MSALARKTDPQTSHLASSGEPTRQTHRLVIAGLLKSNPDSTYRELYARHVAIQAKKREKPIIPDAPALMRRLRSVAERTGERECRIGKRLASTWILLEG